MRKNILYFIYNWGGQKREECWSGTPFGIEESLKERITVADVPLTPESLGNKIIRKIQEKVFYDGYDFSITTTKRGIREINKLISQEQVHSGNPCLVFTEYVHQNVADTYSYQDLSVDFVVRFNQENPELAKFSPLDKHASNRVVKERMNIAHQFNTSCRGLLTMSKWLAKDLVTNTGIEEKRVHWVGGGCNIDVSLIDHTNRNGHRFLFVGKDWERKNGPLVLKAFDYLKQEFPSAELYIAGPVDNPARDGQDGVTFLGRLSYDELVYYYNLCDFFVMPSRYEAYGIVFAEALIFGMPCIGKNCFAMSEFIQDGENGFLIQNDDIDELTEKMKLLITKDSISKNVIEKKDYYLKEYSWDTVADRIINVMRKDGYDI